MTDTDLAFSSISQIAALFRKRKLSPVELTKLLLARIAQLDPKLNSFLTVTADLAVAQARQAERELSARKSARDRGPLHGIPISLKDNIYTQGIRTTAGSKILDKFLPDRDAALVSQLKNAGAVILGKTNLHEFAYGVTTTNPHFGAAHNPWDLSRVPGGSSGGSGAAVAAGLCYGSIGSDTGGSIRIPASLCGVAGLKPTFGRVSVEGVVPLSPTLDCAGPLARTVQDVALLLNPILSRAKGEPRIQSLAKSASKAPKFTLGIPKEFFFDVISPEVKTVFDEAVRILKKQGHKIEPVSLPNLRETEDAGSEIAWPEATLYHQQRGWYPARASEYSEDVRKRLEIGTNIPAIKYISALESRAKFTQQFHATLRETKVDALIVPTTPITAFEIGAETIRLGDNDHSTRALLLRNNRPANLSGTPAISVPCGFTKENLPVGVQFMGPADSEHQLLRLGLLFEQAHPQTRRPALFGLS
jgi:aspartyl-tRNA(Asn)/glutamyl-tRNA(Gln) amidotransferase subunit A